MVVPFAREMLTQQMDDKKIVILSLTARIIGCIGCLSLARENVDVPQVYMGGLVFCLYLGQNITGHRYKEEYTVSARYVLFSSEKTVH